MTNLVDFDRSLAEFLADGPNTAPEAPVIAALAHARTTPRRPDLLRAFRSDVMAPPRRVFGMRPSFVLAAAALAVASIGVAVIGSRQNQISPPGPTSTLIPAPSASDLSPSPSPTPSTTTGDPHHPIDAPAVPPVHIELSDDVGPPTSMDVVDESGLLESATAGPNTSGNGVEQFDATNDSPTVVRLRWPGRPCDTIHRLTIDQTLTNMTIDLPQCRGDLLGVERSLILTFRQPVDATALNTLLIPGRGGFEMPNWTADGPDSESEVYRLSLVDLAYHVEALDAAFDLDRPSDPGPTGIKLVQIDDSSVRLVWKAPACSATPELLIDPSGDRWTLTNPLCAAPGDVIRMLTVTLHEPRQASTITVEMVAAAP